MLATFEPGSQVILVFDTDKPETACLRKNINLLKTVCADVEIITIPQVLAFEDEIERATDVKAAQDFTRSSSVRDFKTAVNRMKDTEFRNALKRHKLDMSRLWAKTPPAVFGFVKQGAEKVKK